MVNKAINTTLTEGDEHFWKMLETKAVDNKVIIEILPNVAQIVEFLRLGIITPICHSREIGLFSFIPYGEVLPGSGVTVH